MSETFRLIDIIDSFISGDWGEENPTEEAPCSVSCIRGADIVPILNSRYDGIPVRFISANSLRNRCLRPGDIVIEKSGGSPVQSTGRTVFVSQKLIEAKGSIVCSNFCQAFRVKPGWNPLYVFYFLQVVYDSGVFFNFEGKTSGLKNLILDSAFQSITINKIPIEEQDRIASILSLIDDKIASNYAIDDSLEAMARQLFEYWFVQYDFPDANGNPYKSSGGELKWDNLLKKNIPVEWTTGAITTILDLLKDGTHNPPKREETGIPLLTGEMFGRTFLNYDKATYISSEDYESIHGRYKPQIGDVILTKIGTVGKVNYLTERDVPIAIHCNSAILRFTPGYDGYYAFYMCSDDSFIAKLKSKAGQSIQQFVSLAGIASIDIEIPSQSIVDRFNTIVKPIQLYLEESRNSLIDLINLKKSTMSLLINGQVKI